MRSGPFSIQRVDDARCPEEAESTVEAKELLSIDSAGEGPLFSLHALPPFPVFLQMVSGTCSHAFAK